MSQASPAFPFSQPAEPLVLTAARSLAARLAAGEIISRHVLNAEMRAQFECFDAAMNTVACPEVSLEPFDFEAAREPTGEGPLLLASALDALTYLALERHHPGWEINDGSCGMLVIEVPEADFVLECMARNVARSVFAA